MVNLPDNDTWARLCAEDGEFSMTCRYWIGGITLRIGSQTLALTLDNGAISPRESTGPGVITFSGAEEVWEKVLAGTPPRFNNDLMANLSAGEGLVREADPVVFAQYYAAVARAVELLRPPVEPVIPAAGSASEFDAPVGRYVHIDIEGHDYRIYFEEAGKGIPLLMQHTAGCHGSQWRHLFEVSEITKHFRLIAYDLPFHGKSMPPRTREWWSETYALEGSFLRSIPVKLSHALGLKDPVFMGCSVGGLLALDLAHHYPDLFRAVISVEGALKIEGDLNALSALWHPQVSNEFKARLMEGLMSPTSPKNYRKETSFVYAAGWPPAFLGDLYYYIEDYDLRAQAAEIDTKRIGVHIMSGEYDYSGRVELGREAHEAIQGSTFTEMKGVGHFPMSENPDAFIKYLMPVLNNIR